MGVVLVRCPEAVGYHWHPPLSLEQVPRLIAVEGERAKMGLVFFRKHPTRRVRFIIQFTCAPAAVGAAHPRRRAE